jgi:transposase
MKQKKEYSQAFKVEATRLAESSSKSISELERDMGITPGLLHKWRRRYRISAEQSGIPGLEPSEMEAAQAEIRRLRRELEVTRQERELGGAKLPLKQPSASSGTTRATV